MCQGVSAAHDLDICAPSNCKLIDVLPQVSSLQRAVMLWNWAVSLRVLWWQHLMALRAMPASALGQGWQVLRQHLCAMRRRVRQDAEVPLIP